jgi:type IX secretion system PorP/SprF family membrane protein
LRVKIGAGIMVDEDKIGSYANQDVIVAGSYKIKFPKSTLSFGLQGTAYFIKADFSSLNLSAPDPNFASYNQVKPNIGAGIYYNKKKFFVGFSVPYLINTKFSSQAEIASQLRQYRNYFLRSGFIQDLSRNVKINPSILIRQQQGQPVSLDVNTSFIFYDLAAAGVSWRSGDSLIGFISLQLFQNFYFNYSFDFTTSDLAPFSAGTQEFMINYRAKINSVHKNLSCPNIYSYRE